MRRINFCFVSTGCKTDESLSAPANEYSSTEIRWDNFTCPSSLESVAVSVREDFTFYKVFKPCLFICFQRIKVLREVFVLAL